MNLFKFFSFSFHAHNERKQADAALCGRSMVEMLGVLAIIGVLSVGAIAGYSKAMFKYKLNKQAEQMNTVINAVARYAHSFSTEYRGAAITSFFIKLGEIPEEMIIRDQAGNINDVYIRDVFGNRWNIYYLYNEKNASDSINLKFNNSELSSSSSQSLEMCRNLIVTIKENSDSITYISTLSGYQTSDEKLNTIRGDNICTGSEICLKNLTLEQIYDFCHNHVGTDETEFKIVWNI